jgi:transposase
MLSDSILLRADMGSKMSAIAVTRMDLDAAGLRRAAACSKDAAAARRMLALALVLEGSSREAAAKSCGMDRQTLRDWVHRYNADGLAGLSNRRPPGAPAKLTAEQSAALAQWVRAGPHLAEDGVIRWRRIDLAAKIEREFGVSLAERSVGDVLHRLGFRRVSVRPQHPNQDAEALEAHKKTSPGWCRPRSRSTPRASRSNSGGRTRHGSGNKAR